MAYDNNINPGNPPLVWSRIKDAFDKVNENFTIIGFPAKLQSTL